MVLTQLLQWLFQHLTRFQNGALAVSASKIIVETLHRLSVGVGRPRNSAWDDSNLKGTVLECQRGRDNLILVGIGLN